MIRKATLETLRFVYTGDFCCDFWLLSLLDCNGIDCDSAAI